MKKLGLTILAVAAIVSGMISTKNVAAQTKEITVKSEGVQEITVIQRALDEAKYDDKNHYKVIVEPGKYQMSTSKGLHIYSNTELDLTGVTIQRMLSAPVGGMLVIGDPRRKPGVSTSPGGGYTIGGYDRGQNIMIIGGTLNAGVNTTNVDAVSSLMTFSHVQNVKLKNMTFIYKPKKKDDAHSIEFGAAKNVMIDGCKKDLYTINIKKNIFKRIQKYAICAYNFKGTVSDNIVIKSGKKPFARFISKKGKKNKLKIKKSNKVRK